MRKMVLTLPITKSKTRNKNDKDTPKSGIVYSERGSAPPGFHMGRGMSWGKPVLRFKSAIFAIFFRSNFFWKAPFSPFFANNKAPFSLHFAPRKKVPFFAIFRQQSAIFRRISLREKKCHFREKFREKQARPNSQPKTGPFFTAFRTATSTIFRHILLLEKSTIVRRISLREKSAIFRENFREKQARPKE
jgi:hypothetical protein